MKAILRNIRISPKKANLVAGVVRGKKVSESLALLKFMPKKAAKIMHKVVHSAASNAKTNFSQSIDDLHITKILVTKGPTYKRSVPISRGRAHPIRKRTSHITVEVGAMGDAALKEVKSVSQEAKETKKAPAAKKSPAKKPATKKTETKAGKQSEDKK